MLNQRSPSLQRYAVALVVAVASLTGLALFTPGQRAAAICQEQVVKSVTATPLNDNKYSVKVSWTKNSGICAYDHFRLQAVTFVTNGGITVGHDTLTKTLNTSTTPKIPGCGKSYTFWVVAEKAGNGNVGTNKTAAATPPCLTVSVTSFTAPSTSQVNASWAAASFATSFSITLKTGSTTIASTSLAGSARTWSYSSASIKCGTIYQIALTAKDGIHTANSSASVATPGCPAPPPTSSGGGSSHHTSSGSTTPAPAAPVKPGVPANFVATLQASKIVQLNWGAVVTTGGDTSYQIDRSTDNANWALLATTGDTSYKDETPDFTTTYYYRLKAVDVNGNSSDYATAQITTEAFKPSDNTITSDDKLATVTIPSDAFSQQVDCSFDSNAAGNAPTLPKDKLLLRGPYGLVCVGEDGFSVTKFDKPLKVVIKLPSGSYKDFDVRQSSGEEWSKVKSTYDPKKRELSFDLTAATFAAFGSKQKSIVGTIFSILLWLLLLAGAVFAVRWFLLRRGPRGNQPSYAMADAGGVASSDVAEQQFEQAALKPSCTHLNMAHQVQPQTAGCAECTAEHKHWKALRICLTCGHVGCSDDSDEQHARKHFESTGHPLIYEYGNPAGDTIGWCYIDQTYI